MIPFRVPNVVILGKHNQVNIISGGDEVSFAFDGATFTPGEYVEESGSRTMTIELTLDGSSIDSGTVMFYIFSTLTDDFSSGEGPANLVDFLDEVGYGYAGNTTDTYFLIIPASGGKIETMLTFVNEEETDSPAYYAVIPLPDGGVAVSDSFIIPGVG